MNVRLSTEKKLDLLQRKLNEDLQIERALKRQISQEFEELKHLEVSLERRLSQRHSAKRLSVKH